MITIDEIKLLSIISCKNIQISEFYNEKLKELYIGDNESKSLNILEYANLKELKILDLSNNKISNIKKLKKVNLKELKELNLSCNIISDINISCYLD